MARRMSCIEAECRASIAAGYAQWCWAQGVETLATLYAFNYKMLAYGRALGLYLPF